MQNINKKDSWKVVDKDGKVYETSRVKSYLIHKIKKLRMNYMRGDLEIVKNG
jgi:hypothetical protein